jgi:mRNA interferase MazF
VVAHGEVWWSEAPDLGRRPVLVLSRDAVLPHLRRPLVAPLTTRERGIPSEVPLDVDDGVPQPCVVSLDNVQPLSAAALVEHLATLSARRMAEVCAALAVAVDCE